MIEAITKVPEWMTALTTGQRKEISKQPWKIAGDDGRTWTFATNTSVCVLLLGDYGAAEPMPEVRDQVAGIMPKKHTWAVHKWSDVKAFIGIHVLAGLCAACRESAPACPDCSGAKTRKCSECHGTKTVTCGECGQDTECRECNDGMDKCYTCKGYGKMPCHDCAAHACDEKPRRPVKLCGVTIDANMLSMVTPHLYGQDVKIGVIQTVASVTGPLWLDGGDWLLAIADLNMPPSAECPSLG